MQGPTLVERSELLPLVIDDVIAFRTHVCLLELDTKGTCHYNVLVQAAHGVLLSLVLHRRPSHSVVLIVTTLDDFLTLVPELLVASDKEQLSAASHDVPRGAVIRQWGPGHVNPVDLLLHEIVHEERTSVVMTYQADRVWGAF